MSVAGISSSNLFDFNSQSVQNRKQQFQQEFQQLGQDLQSGNLSAAQTDFTTLQQSGPQISSTSSNQNTSPSHRISNSFRRTFSLVIFPPRSRTTRKSSRISRVSRLAKHGHHHHQGGGSGRQRDQPVDAGVGSRPADRQSLCRAAGLQHIAAGLPAVCTEHRAVPFIATVQSKSHFRKRLNRPCQHQSAKAGYPELLPVQVALSSDFRGCLSRRARRPFSIA